MLRGNVKVEGRRVLARSFADRCWFMISVDIVVAVWRSPFQ